MIKSSVEELAYFGGERLFVNPKPIGQLYSPNVDEYLQLIKSCFDRKWLTNDGFLVEELECKLKKYHGVSNVVAVANAAIGITMLMQLFANGRKGEVIIPAFSYRGLPHFAMWAGQNPRFCDVDPVTHGLDPDSVEACISADTTSILAVANFNSPGLVEQLTEVAARHDLPLFLDSVYGLGCTFGGEMLGKNGRAEVFSCHATKLLNGFEGGYITTDDDKLADILRWQRNFALSGKYPAGDMAFDYVLGVNAKLNELHAGMALLSLRQLGDVIERNRERYERYHENLASIDGIRLLPFSVEPAEKRNYQLAVLEVDPENSVNRDNILALLRAEGASVSTYYSPPLHNSEHCPAGMEVPILPVAEELSMKYLQLPVGELVSLGDVDLVSELLSFICGNGGEIADRMSGGAVV